MRYVKKYKYVFIFAIILCIATFFRLWQLVYVPPSPSLDEASIGYNAYSILHTGADEYGTRFPILLRAYDDFRPALYVYLVIPFVKVFGLTILAVRLPSIILSIFAIFSVYFLIKALFQKYWFVDILALLSSFLLAISPWSIYVSRLGHEANAGFAFFIFFLTCFFRKKYVFSFLFFALSFASYQSEKVFLPLLFVGMVILYRDELFLAKKRVLLGLLLMVLLLLPFVKASLSPQGLLRFQGTSAFSNETLYSQSAKQLISDKTIHDYIGEIIDNRRLIPVKIFFGNYFSHFNPWWLFTNNGREDFKVPGFGLLYLWELPFLILGIIYSSIKIVSKQIKIFLLMWTAFAFVAPAITTQAPHALRSLTILPVPEIFVGLGLVMTMNLVWKYKSMAYGVGVVMIFLIVLSLKNFIISYFFLFPHVISEPYQYALSQAIRYVNHHKNEYKKIVFSNENNAYQSYMFYLFSSKYDPYQYQQEGGTKSGGFAKDHAFDDAVFRKLMWDKEVKDPTTLYVGNPSDFPQGIDILFRGQYLDGKEGIWIVKG